VSISKFLSGANITAHRLNLAGLDQVVSLEEVKLKRFLDERLISEGGGEVENYAFRTQKLDEIIDSSWRVSLKQAGVN